MKIRLTGIEKLFLHYNKVINVSDNIKFFRIPSSKGILVFQRTGTTCLIDGEEITDFELINGGMVEI